jgi:hypothetical protein
LLFSVHLRSATVRAGTAGEEGPSGHYEEIVIIPISGRSQRQTLIGVGPRLHGELAAENFREFAF